MSNLYALQYRILIFAIFVYNVIYAYLELPYVLNMYSVSDGYNTLRNIADGFHELHLLISTSPSRLLLTYSSRFLFSVLLLVKPLRKIGLLGLVLHATIFESFSVQHTPEVPFLNILYLYLLLVKEKNFYLFSNSKNRFWTYSLKQQRLLWFTAALAYSVSGVFKLMTPAWQSGEFMKLFLTNHLSRFDFSGLISIGWFQIILIALTYIALITELSALPLFFNRYTRFISFTFLTGMQIMILIIADVSQITWAMLVFHIYLFEPRWLKDILRLYLRLTSGKQKAAPEGAAKRS